MKFWMKRNFVLALTVTLLSVSSAPAYASIYDLAADWSNTNNGPSAGNPWSYRAGNSLLPSDPNWTWLSAPFAQPAWAPTNNFGNFLPAWFKSEGSLHEAFQPSLNPGDVVTHTWDSYNGGNNGLSNVLFTAPTSGLATISGSLIHLRSNGDQFFEVLVDGAQLGPMGPTEIFQRPQAFDFTSVPLSAGDTVELLVFGPMLGGSGVGDFVGVSETITITPHGPSAIPLPAALPVFCAGLGIVGLFSWRGRRKPAA
jgi:hypothetical protein